MLQVFRICCMEMFVKSRQTGVTNTEVKKYLLVVVVAHCKEFRCLLAILLLHPALIDSS